MRSVTPRITKRQRKVFELLLEGSRYKEIGAILGVSHKSVERRVAYTARELGAKTAIHAVAILFRNGLIR